MLDGRFHQLLEVLRGRFVANERLGHAPPGPFSRDCKGYSASVVGENGQIIMRNPKDVLSFVPLPEGKTILSGAQSNHLSGLLRYEAAYRDPVP
jgi:hypothetical protein